MGMILFICVLIKCLFLLCVRAVLVFERHLYRVVCISPNPSDFSTQNCALRFPTVGRNIRICCTWCYTILWSAPPPLFTLPVMDKRVHQQATMYSLLGCHLHHFRSCHLHRLQISLTVSPLNALSWGHVWEFLLGMQPRNRLARS